MKEKIQSLVGLEKIHAVCVENGLTVEEEKIVDELLEKWNGLEYFGTSTERGKSAAEAADKAGPGRSFHVLTAIMAINAIINKEAEKKGLG